MRKSYKKLAAVLAVMILALAMANTSFAENATKNLKAYYRNIVVYKDGAKVNFSNEPFILDDGAGGTTYVPLRDMSSMLGKEVKWDGTNYRIDVNDVLDANSIMLQTKVIQQEVTIKNLEAKVKDLEAQLASKNTSSKGNISSVKDMEKYLNDEYGKDSDVYFDIVLKGSKSITLEIYVKNNSTDSKAYQKWSNKDKEKFAEEMVDDIIDELDPTSISGFYKDDYGKTSKENFTVSKKGVVTMGKSSGSSDYTLSDLEYDLNKSYYYKGDVDFDIDVSGTTTKVVLYIDAINDDLDDLTTGQIEDYLEDIYDFIMDELDPSSIKGTIRDNYDRYDFDFNTSGAVNLYY